VRTKRPIDFDVRQLERSNKVRLQEMQATVASPSGTAKKPCHGRACRSYLAHFRSPVHRSFRGMAGE
jgi:hypothetical protein